MAGVGPGEADAFLAPARRFAGDRSVVIPGINYPWTVVDGRPNYGCDFGRNIWNSHTGVSTHEDEVRADFNAMAAMGVEVVRWFVFSDGRGGLQWGRDGRLSGIDDHFFSDMDVALSCANRAGVRVCLVLIDSAWMHDAARRALAATVEGRDEFLRHIVDPLLEAYGTAGRAPISAAPSTHSTSSTNRTG